MLLWYHLHGLYITWKMQKNLTEFVHGNMEFVCRPSELQ